MPQHAFSLSVLCRLSLAAAVDGDWPATAAHAELALERMQGLVGGIRGGGSGGGQACRGRGSGSGGDGEGVREALPVVGTGHGGGGGGAREGRRKRGRNGRNDGGGGGGGADVDSSGRGGLSTGAPPRCRLQAAAVSLRVCPDFFLFF